MHILSQPLPDAAAHARLEVRLGRRCVAAGLLALPVLALAACGDDESRPAVKFAPLSYAYLTPLRLTVGTIEVRDSWQPAPGSADISVLSPVSPSAALQSMAQDRLVASGSGGRAVFRIEDAGIDRNGDQLQGHFAVQLDIYVSDNTRTAFAEARVARATDLAASSAAELRAALYELTKQMMADMNVEFEYQVRRSLGEWLQPGEGMQAVPAPVTAQPL